MSTLNLSVFGKIVWKNTRTFPIGQSRGEKDMGRIRKRDKKFPIQTYKRKIKYTPSVFKL
jgi:hypothetical protein